MFVWIDTITKRSIGFGLSASLENRVFSHVIDADIYAELIKDPNKLRWGRLVQTESGSDFRIIPPPAVKKFRCARTAVAFAQTRSATKADLNLWLDDKGYLHVECTSQLPDLYLTVCPGSIFLPTFCHSISLGMQPARNLRRALLRNPSSQVFLSNVWFEWTSLLTVQINKGQ